MGEDRAREQEQIRSTDASGRAGHATLRWQRVKSRIQSSAVVRGSSYRLCMWVGVIVGLLSGQLRRLRSR